MESLASSDVFLFEGFRFDRRGGGLFRQDENGAFVPVAIGSRALDILGLLIARRGELVSKEKIIAAVWPGAIVEDSNLTVQISALRRVLDAGRAQGSCIQTVAGRGYRFVMPVYCPEDGARQAALAIGNDRRNRRGDAPPLPAAASPSDAVGPRRLRRRFVVGTLAMLALASAILSLRESHWSESAGAPRLSIVVLPFENYSAGHDQDYFADGITEDLTTDLSRIPGSFVIARNTAFTYKGKRLGARQIAGELGVRYVLEGSVQRIGDRVRVNAQLIDAGSGAHLWAERFDWQTADLLQIQDEITRQIAAALDAELVEAESERLEREHAVNPDAVDLAMRGRALMLKPHSAERDAQARHLFEQALAIDPKSIDALLGLALTYLIDAGDLFIRDFDEGSRLASDAIGRALAVDPRNAEAYGLESYALAFSTERDYRGRIDQAIDAAETAIGLDPNFVHAYTWLGRLYSKAGHPERTPALIEKAIRLSPRDPSMSGWFYILGTAQLQMGHAVAAIETFRKSLILNPDLFISQCNLAAAYLAAGRDSEAREALAAARKMAKGAALARQPARIDEQLQRMRVQLALLRRNYWPFAVEGSANAWFARALRAFQHDQHLPETGIADPATLARLGISPLAVGSATR